jgi:mannose-6-phosphate isomerase-like protein (cupin superfamily)
MKGYPCHGNNNFMPYYNQKQPYNMRYGNVFSNEEDEGYEDGMRIYEENVTEIMERIEARYANFYSELMYHGVSQGEIEYLFRYIVYYTISNTDRYSGDERQKAVAIYNDLRRLEPWVFSSLESAYVPANRLDYIIMTIIMFTLRNIDIPAELQRQSAEDNSLMELKDYGPEPFVINIDEATKQNDTYRTALWTGRHLQVTLMSLKVGEDIGLEIHPNVDQFLRIEEGQGVVMMGDSRNNLDFQERVYDDFAILIPAGKWHNLVNTGNIPLKLYSIYAPPQHPHGTVHETKADAMAVE